MITQYRCLDEVCGFIGIRKDWQPIVGGEHRCPRCGLEGYPVEIIYSDDGYTYKYPDTKE